MKKELLLIALVGLILLASMPVNAQTITISNPNGISERDIIVYYANGTMQGFYNSTSVITLDSSLDYLFMLKPMSTNLLEDPTDWLTNNAFPFVESNATAIVIIVVVIGLFFMRWK